MFMLVKSNGTLIIIDSLYVLTDFFCCPHYEPQIDCFNHFISEWEENYNS